jgi:malate dehydrogenase (oxaloacetate-decarboxylating)
MSSPGLVRTLRIRSQRKPGVMGLLTTALGDAGASVGEIVTVRLGHNYTLRDFSLLLDDDAHLQHVLDTVGMLQGSHVVEIFDPVVAAHRGGKVRMRARVAVQSPQSLFATHVPGVRQMVRMLDDDPRLVPVFSGLARSVAIVTDGSGLAGMNKVRAQALYPVVEGKAALLDTLAGLSGLPLILDGVTEDQLVDTVCALGASFRAVLLDAIAAPRSHRAAMRIQDKLQVPVFLEGSDGPAVVALAAIMNACKLAKGGDFSSMQVGQVGLGTAGGAIARLVMRHQRKPVWGDDVHPSAVARHISFGGEQRSLADIMKGCDVVVLNTGNAGLVPPTMVREGQIILALSEPLPEIEPYDATLAGAAHAIDGRSISTAAAFPGILLGALAVHASIINDDMRIAAAITLAQAADGGDLVPTPLTPGVHAEVARAVAAAALASGVARIRVPAELLTTAVFQQAIDDERLIPLTPLE